MKPAATLATFSDFKLVKTRKLAQLIFELPIGKADEALAALGGLPRSDDERWCGIALVNKKSATVAGADAGTAVPRSGPMAAGNAPSEAVADGALVSTGPEGADGHPLVQTPEAEAQGQDKPGKPRRRFSELPRSQQAGILCQDQRFIRWLNAFDPNNAAEIVRQRCGVESRAAIETDVFARRTWDNLITGFQRDTGQMAEQRA